MNSFVFAFCAVVLAVQAATIPKAPEAPKQDHGSVAAPSITAAHSIPFPALSTDKVAERNFRQLYPAGYQVSPYAPPQKAVYSPYAVAPAAPAYPYPAYYQTAYPGYPRYPQYVPLREGEAAGAEESSWSSYIPSYSSFSNYFNGAGSYFSNYPSYFWGSETESSSASGAEAENNSGALLRSGLPKDSKVQTINSVNSITPFNPAPQVAAPAAAAPLQIDNRFRYQPAPVAQPPFVIAGSPQFYGAYSAFGAQQDPSKLTGANNGAISSYLFLRNQPQLPVFQQHQQKFAAPGSFQTGNVENTLQQFTQFSKELQGEQSKTVEKEAASSEKNDVVSDSDAPVNREQNAEQLKKEDDPSESPSVNTPIASAKPKGLAVADEGGVAEASPKGTALVGKKGMALAAPSGIAIAGPDTPLSISIETQHQAQHKNQLHSKVQQSREQVKPVARYSDVRGYHIDYPRAHKQ